MCVWAACVHFVHNASVGVCNTLIKANTHAGETWYHLLRYSHIQPITDRVAQHLEIISKNFQFSTRRTRILMCFIIYYLVLIVNPMGRILVRWKSFRNNLEMLCHPICNGLYRRSHMWSHSCTPWITRVWCERWCAQHTVQRQHTHRRILSSHVIIFIYTVNDTCHHIHLYGVATISRLLKTICLFCKRAL